MNEVYYFGGLDMMRWFVPIVETWGWMDGLENFEGKTMLWINYFLKILFLFSYFSYKFRS